MTNWNQSVARGVGAADNAWGKNGSVNRVDLLNKNLDRLSKGGEWNLAEVTSAMNAAATQDVRAIDTVPLLARLLEGSTAPNAQAAAMLAQLVKWNANGGNRLDTTGDGLIDAPGAASMDGAWDGIANALMERRLKGQLDELASLATRYSAPPGGQFAGWGQYFDRDIRRLLGEDITAPLNLQYCGRGNLATCQADVWAAIAAAGAQLEADQGSANPAAWRSSATAEEITFAPINLLTMAYTNRPTGIQQVISFKGGR